MSMMWVGIGSIAAGAITSGIGQDKQRKASNQANDANKKAVADTNAANAANTLANNKLIWGQYLAGRGINAGPDVTPGVIPTNYTAINSKLPLWSSVTRGGGMPTRTTRVASAMAPHAPMPTIARTGAADSAGRSWAALGL